MSRTLRAWVGGIVQETNAFSPIPTAFEDFEDFGGDRPRWPGYGEFIEEARAAGLDVCAGRLAFALPAAPASARTWQRLRDDLLAELAAAGPVDLVWLPLHGAQMSAGCDDCEGELIAAVRAQVGPACRIGVLLDLHANITPTMLREADLVVACHLYPHTDLGDRARHAARALIRSLHEPVRWTTAAWRVPAFGAFPTTEPPFDDLVRRLQACEREPGVVAAADGTQVLAALLARDEPGLRPAAFGMLWDPHAVAMAWRAGEGTRLMMRLGGKTGPLSGAPVDAEVFVEALRDDVKQAIFVPEPNTPIGRSALLRIDGAAGPVHIVIADQRHQVFTPHVFTGHGLDLAACRLVVVKSTQHFHAAFAPLASAIVRCDAGGTVTSDPTQLPYRHRPRPCWRWEAEACCTPMHLGETA